MKPPVYSTSFSLHHIFRPSPHPIIQEWKRHLPTIRPCYALSTYSTQQTITLMRDLRIPMICETPGQRGAVNDYMLTIEGRRFGSNEYIARSISDTSSSSSPRAPNDITPPMWVYTKISHEGIEHSRKMFEHIWAHKYIIKGIVFDIHNFAANARGSIPPSMYSYKIAIDYLFRNIVRPFEKEYGIRTPCIMMDGRRHITRIEHLEELKTHIEPALGTSGHTEFRLIVDDLFDNDTYTDT